MHDIGEIEDPYSYVIVENGLFVPSGRTINEIIDGVTVSDRKTERKDLIFLAQRIKQLIPSREILREIIDKTWMEATESSNVPSTSLADKIIDSVVNLNTNK